jgi:hypothetical protein
MAYLSNVDSEVLRVVHHYWRHGDDIRMTVSDHAEGRRAVHLAGPRELICPRCFESWLCELRDRVGGRPKRFDPCGADVTEVAVGPFGVVKVVDVVGHRRGQLEGGRPFTRVEQFDLQPWPKTTPSRRYRSNRRRCQRRPAGQVRRDRVSGRASRSAGARRISRPATRSRGQARRRRRRSVRRGCGIALRGARVRPRPTPVRWEPWCRARRQP